MDEYKASIIIGTIGLIITLMVIFRDIVGKFFLGLGNWIFFYGSQNNLLYQSTIWDWVWLIVIVIVSCVCSFIRSIMKKD